jgi:hypothetical protein
VWVTACLLRRGWGFYGGSEVFWWIYAVEKVSGGGACDTRAIAGDDATRRQSRFVLLVYGVLFFKCLFTICLCDAEKLLDYLLS